MTHDPQNAARASAQVLEIYVDGEHVAQLEFDDTAAPTLTYCEGWIESPGSFPVSLSMPLSSKVHGSPVCFNYFDNLLPEGKFRDYLASAIHADRDSLNSLIRNFNADLPGALRIRPKSTPPAEVKTKRSKILLEWDVLNRFLEDERPTSQLLSEKFEMAFSLAGLQDKFTCQYDARTRQMFLTDGMETSTHIVKVNLKWKNSRVVENEFFCLSLAKSVGLIVTEHKLENIRSLENPILILTRYDRYREKNKAEVCRRHQEDFCQVFGAPLAKKYESEGGQSFLDIYKRLRSESSNPIADLDMLLNWLCFNFIIGNADSHAKNISLLLQAGSVRLAPLYDLVSTEIYGSRFRRRFAFQIGGENECDKVRKRNIQVLEGEIGVKEGFLVRKFWRMADLIENRMQGAAESLEQIRPESSIPKRVERVIRKRILHIRKHF
jgi:serine/threonine-protein kinase HipA